MGPLAGLKVIEMQGLGPAPFCGMMLGDMGADVVRIDRPVSAHTPLMDERKDVMQRNKRSLVLDLKNPAGVELLLELVAKSDVLIEGFRPGVMERLGMGPEACLKRNPKLVFGRMTGFGQTGPYAKAAGHDINYAALSGALGQIGPSARPVIPLNLVADFGGGGMYLAFGVVAAVFHALKTGEGQVVDATMVDGAASLTSIFYGLRASGLWTDKREDNFLDGGAGHYNVYETKDGQWISIGALEPQFYRELLQRLGLENEKDLHDYENKATWKRTGERFTEVFKTKTRDEWDALLASTDVCYAPILNFGDAHLHPHNVARETFATRDGVLQPSPAPRFSKTPGALQRLPPRIGEQTREVLEEYGFDAAAVEKLAAVKAIKL